MQAPDPTTEQAIAAARLQAISNPDLGPSQHAHRLPPTFQSFRTAAAAHAPKLDPGRPGRKALLAIGAVAAIIGALYAWQSRPAAEPLAPPPAAAPPKLASPTPTGLLTVHVTGKVRTPGVYTLPTGSRVTDAVAAAGGIRPGAPTGAINLARRLVDGEQIAIGAPTAPGGPTMPDTASAVLDLNTATPAQLEQLPGVGEVLAARITTYRDAHGGFRSVEQLKEVTGIGPRKYDELKDKVRV